ncbi:DUF2829 domain-containing protein [Spirosoma sp. RP8]|uniref:DUF2829 domain-containing protein n=1 Tax=Spirosoma liriopis TaxID=2937440 RepID=A0ABT0HL34_9BACT|nr:DUF2829 domain-containing protein [Spirosoma liriopis]MCK8492886.1 DUF2829 domain-containing protein [Spirosoma liriopis]
MLSFSLALEAVKQGKRIARVGWNGKGMFVFMRPGDALTVDTVVNKVKSLPHTVKDYYAKMHEGYRPLVPGEEPTIKFTSYLCMVAADGFIVNGWLASQTDMLAEDWTILD